MQYRRGRCPHRPDKIRWNCRKIYQINKRYWQVCYYAESYTYYNKKWKRDDVGIVPYGE